nr:hypothetical protein Ade03nite_55740 [Actinoplanes derwentensis]
METRWNPGTLSAPVNPFPQPPSAYPRAAHVTSASRELSCECGGVVDGNYPATVRGFHLNATSAQAHHPTAAPGFRVLFRRPTASAGAR